MIDILKHNPCEEDRGLLGGGHSAKDVLNTVYIVEYSGKRKSNYGTESGHVGVFTSYAKAEDWCEDYLSKNRSIFEYIDLSVTPINCNEGDL